LTRERAEELAKQMLTKIALQGPSVLYKTAKGPAAVEADSLRAQRVFETEERRIIGTYNSKIRAKDLADDIEYAFTKETI
jgi:hypothetical protein